MEALFDTWSGGGAALRLTRLGFDHAFALLEPDIFDEPARASDVLLETYLAQIECVGAGGPDAGAAANEAPRQTLPYNLLVTRRWMLTVPRTQERFDSTSVNALGFAGSLYVGDDEALRRVETVGPMAVLQAVGRRPAVPGGMRS
jgi:ATP adenylyltransferase